VSTAASGPEAARLRPARLADVPDLGRLINGFATRNLMLSRSAGELYETIRDFQVVEAEGALLGCVATHVYSARISELKSLAVDAQAHGRGLGKLLVRGCLAEAGRLGLDRVFCLTYQVAFFESLGFEKVDRSLLPEKVWGECVRCNRFLDCDEVALWAQVPQA
jgi:amino-acid N-acetyltransferase